MTGRRTVWFAAVFALLLAAAFALDRAFPPDLSRYEARSALVVDREGNLLRAFLSRDDKWRLAAAAGEVSPEYVRLLIAYEDRRFFLHPGVDPLAVLRAAFQYVRHGEIVSGGSTLTMQAARLLEPGATRTVGAKLRQMLRALQLELRYSKREILDIYLTLAPFGGNVEGVHAASFAWFGKESRHLTVAEAALLVALPQSPERQRPDRHPEAAAAGRAKVLARLHEAGAISGKAYREAREEPVPSARRAFPFHTPRLARALVRDRPGKEIVPTHIDGDLQRMVEHLISAESNWLDDGAAIAVIVADNATQQVRAYVGGSDFGMPGGQVDLARAPRSPGSALKPFIYALAFHDLALHPETLIEDAPRVFGAAYAPRNFGGDFKGTVSLRTALQKSLNVPAVALLDRVGPSRFAAALRAGGGRLVFDSPDVTPSLPVALGGVGISLFDITSLYAGLASGGVGGQLSVTPLEPRMAGGKFLDPVSSWYVGDILRGAPPPSGWPDDEKRLGERTIAFKTGTSYGFRDAWALGYTQANTVGVWVGRPDGSSRPGRIGRNEAAPMLLKVFDLLPRPAEPPSPPRNAIVVRSRSELPPPMRRFAFDRGTLPSGASGAPPPAISFPPHGSVLALPRSTEDGYHLSAVGGAEPLRWVVNGRPLSRAGPQDPVSWRPDGHGFADIVVIDSEGRSDRTRVRVVE
ncbi:MAG: penicillin-binding protein 1C [Alphaproteobacteria bacterium]